MVPLVPGYGPGFNTANLCFGMLLGLDTVKAVTRHKYQAFSFTTPQPFITTLKHSRGNLHFFYAHMGVDPMCAPWNYKTPRVIFCTTLNKF